MIDTPTQEPWGCDGTTNSQTDLITTSLKWEGDAGPAPCTKDFPDGSSSYATLRDLLDAANVSWKYYTPCFSKSDGCTVDPKCPSCAGDLLNAFDVIWAVRNGPEWGTNVSMPETNIFNDISNGSLPAVSWVIPEDQNSDHIGDGDASGGPAWVASVVNAVGKSSYWNSTAIVIVWDDWGGLYDNAAPALLDQIAMPRRPGRPRLPRADDRRLAVCKVRSIEPGWLCLEDPVRVRQHPKIRREQLRPGLAGNDRHAGDQHCRLLQLQSEASLLYASSHRSTTRITLSRTASRFRTATPSNGYGAPAGTAR